MSDDLVIEAFQSALILAVGASLEPEIPIKMLGRTFEIPNDQKYFEVVHIVNNVNGEFWGDGKTYQGIFRVILHWPFDDLGVYEPIKVVMSVAEFFDKKSTFYMDDLPLKIYEAPDFTGVLETSHDALYPVTMPYRSFRP